MTMVSPEVGADDPENWRLSPGSIDDLLKNFPDLGPETPGDSSKTSQQLEDEAAQAIRILAAGINDRVEDETILDDVRSEDEERHFGFKDLAVRLPFKGFSLKRAPVKKNTLLRSTLPKIGPEPVFGEVVLSDRILTTLERERREARNAELERMGNTPGEDVGFSAARHNLEKELDDIERRRGIRFSKDAKYVAKLALTELCSNTDVHGAGGDANEAAGRFETRYFPEQDQLIVMAINSPRFKRGKDGETRAVQTHGRGISIIKGFVGEKNMGRLRVNYNPKNNEEHLYTSRLSDMLGLGGVAIYACIDRDLVDPTSPLNPGIRS